MEKDKMFIELNEVGNTALKLIGSKELEELFKNCENANQDFRQGAMWGMAILSTYLGAYSKKYSGVDKNELDTVIWHDCKTDPPKDENNYILCFFVSGKLYLDFVWYFKKNNMWEGGTMGIYNKNYIPYKWAKISPPKE